MMSIFLSFQKIRYTIYLGYLLLFAKRRNRQVKTLAFEQESKSCDNNLPSCSKNENYDWGQFVEIDCY